MTDVDTHSLTVEFNRGGVRQGDNYLIDGIGMSFLAGKVMWCREGKAGLFFKQGLHPETVLRLKSSAAHALSVELRPVA